MVKKSYKFLLPLLLVIALVISCGLSNAYASNVQVTEAEVKNLDLEQETATISFKVSQDDPYPDAGVLGAYDYIWIFAKYWMDNNDDYSTGWHKVVLQQDKFVLASNADGATSFELSWDFSGDADQDLVSHLSSGGQVKVKVGAVEMVKVPADPLTGSDSFYIAKYEVSQAQYTDYLNMLADSTGQARWENTISNGYTISYDSGASYGSRFSCTAGERAVNFISYDDATNYVDWVGLRLPTEVEFEKAATGPSEIDGVPNSRKYPWGDTEPTSGNSVYASGDYSGHYKYYTNFGNLTNGKKPLEVGHYQSGDISRDSEQTGVSPFSIPDLAGNVSEWIYNSENDYGLKGGDFATVTSDPKTNYLKISKPSFTGISSEARGLRPAK